MDIKTISTLVGVAIILVLTFFFVIRSSSKHSKRKREAEAHKKASQLMSEGRHSQATAKLVAAGNYHEALDLLVGQNDYKGAARVALRMKEPVRAGELFERGGDYEAAANAFMKIPDLRRAAECWARAGNHSRASEIYVQIGDIWAAAEELVTAGLKPQAAALHRQLGNDLIAAKLVGEDLRDNGNYLDAAQEFLAANDHEASAECLVKAGKDREAAETYQIAGRPDLAAPLLEKCGAIPEAAAMYEEAGDHTAAARLYQHVKDPDREVEALVAAGEILAAGRLAYKLGNKDRAEEILRLAAPADRGFVRSCLLLGRILEEAGRLQEGLKYYTLFVERGEPSDKTRSIWEYLVGLFERNNYLDVAIGTLRKLEGADMLSDELRSTMDRAVTNMREDRASTAEPSGDPSEVESSVPTQLADRYKVLSRLGEGGTAVVYLAVDKVLKREVVLKILSNPSLPGELAEEYFLREAQIVAGMSHPNIVTIFDVGNAGNRLYQVMEYIEGRSLDEVLSVEKKGFPLERVARIGTDLARAIGYAHERKIIHRDIKPGNIMMLPDGSVKLMDFGMAKALEVHRDRSAYICGTPDYMSPEQEAGHDLTPSSDIYSFGLVLLEALLGSLPGALTAPAARLKRLEALEASSIPAKAAATLKTCLSLEAQERPASAKLVADGLARDSL